MSGAPSGGRRFRADDGGAGSVLAVAVIAVVMAAAAVGTAVIEAVAVRHVAAGAADASALAAASRARLGPAAACASAARVARADGARLTSCDLAGAVATVTVSAAMPVLLGWQGTARLNARAGPAETYREKPAPLGAPS